METKYLKQVYKIISVKIKSKIPILLFLLILNSLFEVLSLTSILPLMNALLDENFAKLIFSKIANEEIKNFLISFNHNQQILFFSFILIIIFFLKYCIYLIALNYNLNLSKKLTIELSKKIMSGYFKTTFKHFAKTNTSLKFTNVFVGIRYITIFYVKSFLNLALELFLIIFVVILILYLQPYASGTAILFFSLVSIIFFKINKNKINYLSNLTQEHDKRRIKSFNEIMILFKEILIFKKENFFKNKFLNNLELFENSSKKINLLKAVPRPILEFFGTITIILFLIISFYYSNYELSKVITEVAIITAAGFRLLPSVNRAMVSIVEMKSSLPYLSSVFKSGLLNKNLIKNYNSDKILKKDIFFKDSLEFKNISFEYEKNKKIINNISLEIKTGDKIGIMGKSGEGKSTLLELICGLYKPKNGIIKIDGKKIDYKKLRSLSIAYVSQNNILFEGSILENIIFGYNKNTTKIDRERIELILKILNLSNFVNSLNRKLDTTVGEMGSRVSGGQKQRLSIARALYHNPQILVLDEATNSLDSNTENNVIKNIIKYFSDLTIIFVSHKKKSLNFCNKIFQVSKKKLLLNHRMRHKKISNIKY